MYLLLVYIVLEHKSDGRGPISVAVVKDKDMKGTPGYDIFIYHHQTRL